MKAIILCAGKGERLKPLTDNLPKPMILIDNKPVLEYLILLCKKHNITDIAINTSHLPEKIKNYFGNGERFGVNITYSFESELLGTAGALNNFRNFLNDTFLVIYGDNITDLNLTKMIEYHKIKQAFATLHLYKEPMVDEKSTLGCTLIDENNRVIYIIENPNEEEKIKLMKIPEEKKLINTGFYVLEPEILNLIPEGFSDFSKDILPKALELGKPIYGFKQDCYFKEVGQMMRYNKAKQDIESGNVKLDL